MTTVRTVAVTLPPIRLYQSLELLAGNGQPSCYVHLLTTQTRLYSIECYGSEMERRGMKCPF